MSGTTKLLIGCWSIAGLIFAVSLTLTLSANETTPHAVTLHGAARFVALGAFIAGWGALIRGDVRRLHTAGKTAQETGSGATGEGRDVRRSEARAYVDAISSAEAVSSHQALRVVRPAAWDDRGS